MADSILVSAQADFKNAIYNPEGFQPTDWLPPELHKFGEHVRWLVHKLYTRRIFDRRNPDAFIQLKAAYLRRVLPFRQYRDILQAAADSGLIEWDKKYVKDVESRKYRLRKELRESIHRRYLIQSHVLNKKLDNLRAEKGEEIRLDVHRHLWRFLREVEIQEHALDATENDEQAMQVRAIQDRVWHFTHDDYGRVHTNLTNLHTPLRDYLSWKGQNLVNLDVRNSQPLLFSILLLNWFGNNGYLDTFLRFSLEGKREEMYFNLPEGLITGGINKVQNEQIPPFLPPPHPLYDVTFSSRSNPLLMGLPEDVQRYIVLCQDGQFYNHLMAQGNVPVNQRREFKTEFFGKVFFGKNRTRSAEKNLFRSLFPSVHQVIEKLKEEDYTQLAKLLQRVESSLVISRVVRRMMGEHPDTFVTTIHDSLIVPESSADVALRVMRQEFVRVGLYPTIEAGLLAAPGRPATALGRAG